MHRTRNRHPAARAGFTLLELGIVLVIAGILMGSAAPVYVQQVHRQRVQATRTELETIRRALVDTYQSTLRLPDAGKGQMLPVSALRLAPAYETDEIYAGSRYVYVVTNDGKPFTELFVDGGSIGRTAAVVFSRGRNLKSDATNVDPSKGKFTQTSAAADFDDVLVAITESELRAATAWRREITEDIAVLNAAAQLLADNDDDGDGFIDEDGGDAAGNADGMRVWTVMDTSGLDALARAGRVSHAEHLVDAWGARYRWDRINHRFYSCGPNGTDEAGAGDDLVL